MFLKSEQPIKDRLIRPVVIVDARQGESKQSCLALALHHHSEKRHLNILGTICERDLKQ